MTSSGNESSVTILTGGFPSSAPEITHPSDSPYAKLLGRKVSVTDGAVEGLTGIVVALGAPSRVVISIDCPGCYVEIEGHSIAAIDS